MAVITLVANTDYSALSVADGDTIALSTFTLNLDAIPAQINVIVSTSSTGKMTLLSATNYPLTGWTMTAGTGPLIDSVPSGTTLGGTLIGGATSSGIGCTTNSGTITNCTGGTGGNSFGCITNSGTITNCTGGSGTSFSYGCQTNNGTITTCVGGTAGNSVGCGINNATITTLSGGANSGSVGVVINSITGTIGTVVGGSGIGTVGVLTNNGTITQSTGGGVSGTSGCTTNNGTIITTIGGSHATAFGVSTNNGLALNITDATAKAVNVWNGLRAFCIGDGVRGTIPANITTLYVQGALHASAIVSGSTTVIVLSSGTARPFHPLSTPQVIG